MNTFVRIWLAVLYASLSILVACAVPENRPSDADRVAQDSSTISSKSGVLLIGAEYPVRWFPKSVRFAPDDSHLLVSLCHFKYGYYCRIARYWPAEKRWEIVPAAVGESMAWPEYSPDGRRIVYSHATCGDTYRCGGTDFSLAIMDAQGSNRRDLEPARVQMPTWSPDGKRLMYWRVQGSGNLSSGRSFGYWSLYEFEVDGAASETRLTDDIFTGIYSTPRYLPGGERLLFGAYRGSSSPDYTFVVDRREAIDRVASGGRLPTPAWDLVKTQFIHAFDPTRGWLVGYKNLWFQTSDKTLPRRYVLKADPYTIPVADVSHDGKWLVALTGIPAGTMRDAGGGVADYWAESPGGQEGPPHTPVMTLIDLVSPSVQAVTNWPRDVERVTSPPQRLGAAAARAA